MLYRKCEICGIRSGRRSGEKRVFMTRFPTDETRCRQWVKATGNLDLAYVPIEKLHQLKFICGKHFRQKDFNIKGTRLKRSAFPTLLLNKAPLSDEVLQDFPLRLAKNSEDASSLMAVDNTNEPHNFPSTSRSTENTFGLGNLGSKAAQDQPKPSESSAQVYDPTGSSLLEPTATSVEEQAIGSEISEEEEEYLETFDDDLGHEVEEEPKKEGPFSWQKHTEKIVALDENVAADDDVTFCGEAQLVPDLSEPVSQTQEEYSCNACNERITGVRYVCVVCADWDLCGACEALQHHPRHYVLRVPPGKPRSETAWVIATLRQMLASREDPDLPVVKVEVKSEDPLADMDVPFEAREDDADDVHQTRDLDTDSIEDVDERMDTDRTFEFPSTPQKRSTTAYPEAVPSKKRKHVVLKVVPIQRKDITGNVVMLGKHKTDNPQDIGTRTTQKKLHMSMDDLKKHIPQLETSKVTTWDATRKQNVTATIQKPKSQNETGTVISLDDLMKKIDVGDQKQKITVIAAPVEQKVSQIGTDQIILQKGVVSLKKPTHVVDSTKIIVAAGPGKKTSHIQSDRVLLFSKKIVKLEEPKRVTVAEKMTPESGETILLDDTISDIVQPTESAVMGLMGSPAESWNTVQALETSPAGTTMLKVLQNSRKLRVNMTRLRDDDIQNATQPSTSKR